MIGLKAEPVLRDLGMRGDIIKTMHRAFTERGQDRGIADIADYVIARTTLFSATGRISTSIAR
jgi:type IV secretory pathway VirD2 relaxase